MTVTVPTRRERLRLGTVVDIKAAAWADMEATGSTDCSLRGVARRMGMAPSAIYRYFASRDELLTALIIDSFEDLTLVLRRAYEATQKAGPPAGEAFVSVASAYRQWALDHRLAYQLIFGNPVGGYAGTTQTTEASMRSTAVLLDVMADLVSAGRLDVDRVAGALTEESRERFDSWAETLPPVFSAPALAAAMTCYAALHGALALETNGHLPPVLRASEEVFTTLMRQTVRSIVVS